MIIACKNLMLDLKAPASKSAYHRELIVNYVLGARGEYLNIKKDDNDDVIATKRCLAELSAASDTGDDDIILPANESGSTLRFLLPAAAGRNSPGVLSLFVHFLFARAKRKWTLSRAKQKTRRENSRPAFVVILPFSSPVSGRSSSPSRRA